MKKPKVIIYDNDGMLTNGARFSEQYCKDFGIDMELMSEFFNTKFRDVLHGKKDLKEELIPYLSVWQWKGTVDELLEYWFSKGADLDKDVYSSVQKLKDQGVICVLATNQEKYRTEALIKMFKYDSLFDHIFSSSYLGTFKTTTEGLKKIHDEIQEKHGVIGRDEIMYWDDREGNVEHLTAEGFNGQLFTDFNSFKQVLVELNYNV